MAMPPGPGPMGGPPMGVGPGGPVTPQQAMMHQQAQMAGGPPPGMNPGQPMPGGPPHPGPGQGPPGPGQPMEQPRFDNISKAKALVPQLKESLMDVFKVAAATISGNNMIDSGLKPVEIDPGRFDRSLEKFFSICDLMEVHLKTSVECINQGMSSSRYLSTVVTPAKMEGHLTYPQYINIVKGQIAFAKELHDSLAEAAQKLSD